MSPMSPQNTRLLEHITGIIHDVRDDLAHRIEVGSANTGEAINRLTIKVDQQGERLTRVEQDMAYAKADVVAPPKSSWRRDGTLVLGGGGAVAVVDTLFTWLRTHLGI